MNIDIRFDSQFRPAERYLAEHSGVEHDRIIARAILGLSQSFAKSKFSVAAVNCVSIDRHDDRIEVSEVRGRVVFIYAKRYSKRICRRGQRSIGQRGGRVVDMHPVTVRKDVLEGVCAVNGRQLRCHERVVNEVEQSVAAVGVEFHSHSFDAAFSSAASGVFVGVAEDLPADRRGQREAEVGSVVVLAFSQCDQLGIGAGGHEVNHGRRVAVGLNPVVARRQMDEVVQPAAGCHCFDHKNIVGAGLEIAI